MIKRYFQHELDRYRRHPKIYTALAVAYVVHFVCATAYGRKLEAEISELIESL